MKFLIRRPVPTQEKNSRQVSVNDLLRRIMATLPDEIKPALQGGIPAVIVTCSLDGVPNVTYVSDVHYVDGNHVALTFQFFNKTSRNIRENPNACIIVRDPQTLSSWVMEVRYDHSETEGPIFDTLDMQLEIIASLTGMSHLFKLKAADIYEVKSVKYKHEELNAGELATVKYSFWLQVFYAVTVVFVRVKKTFARLFKRR